MDQCWLNYNIDKFWFEVVANLYPTYMVNFIRSSNQLNLYPT